MISSLTTAVLNLEHGVCIYIVSGNVLRRPSVGSSHTWTAKLRHVCANVYVCPLSILTHTAKNAVTRPNLTYPTHMTVRRLRAARLSVSHILQFVT